MLQMTPVTPVTPEARTVVVLGLGNPGRGYELTRHNMGFLTLDELSDRLSIPIQKIRHKSLVGEGRAGGRKIVLAKPQTFMNLSGEAVRPLVEYYGAELSDVLLVYDDIDLAVGDIRIRRRGSAGTHNGMRSVIRHLGRDDFPRIRIGIGQSGCIPLEKYVLMKIPSNEAALLAGAVQRAAEACETFIRSGIDETMRQWNSNAADADPDEKGPEGS